MDSSPGKAGIRVPLSGQPGNGCSKVQHVQQLAGLSAGEKAGKPFCVRPVMMTALTAIFGLLPAALSTKIGAQTQRPLAIVVVGGMIATLFLTRYLMPVLYSFYGHREPAAAAGHMAH